MDISEFAQLIKTRRSIRSWQDKPVDEQKLIQAIELATWAPNAGNWQNWRFFIIMNKEIINSIADLIQSTNSKMMSWIKSNSNPHNGSSLRAPRGDEVRFAPALIAFTGRKFVNPMEKIIEERSKTDPEAKIMIDGLKTINVRIQSIAAAIAYLLLALHQIGLVSLWITGDLKCKSSIEELLKIPPDLDIVALVPVGYPAESPVRHRKPVSEVIEIIR